MAERLVIKGDDLLEAYNKIVYLHGEFDAATARSDDAASSVGHPGLKSELENVAGSWRIHRGKILESLADMESQIKGTLDTFGDVDDRMAQNLGGDGGHQAPADPGGGSTPPPSPPSTPRPQPQPSTREPAPTPAQPAPLVGSAPEAVARPVPAGRDAQEEPDVVEPTWAPGQVDLSDFPPEMRVLLDKVRALTSSPDFIAKYPQFAAGASLGALLPLLLTGRAGHSGGGRDSNGGASESRSARDEVRNLLQGVRKDVADGHLDAMTPGEARAELERLLGGTDADPDTAGADTSPGGGDAQALPAREREAAAEPPSKVPDASPTPDDSTGAGQPGGSSGGSGSASSTPTDVPDFREGSPMQNEDPDAVGQVPTTPGAGEGPSAPSGTGPVVTDPTGTPGSSSTASTADNFSAPRASTSSGAPSSPGEQGRADATEGSAANHIPTPMMSSGSMGGGGSAGSTMSSGGSTAGAQGGSTAQPSGTSTSSSRTSTEKTAETRKAEVAEAARTEGDAR